MLVKVAPVVEVMKGESAKLPCTYTTPAPSGNTVVEWYIVSHIQIVLHMQVLRSPIMQNPLVHVSSTSTCVPSVERDSESFRKKDSLTFCPDPFI